jgi:hypothetical protein
MRFTRQSLAFVGVVLALLGIAVAVGIRLVV